MPVRQGRGARSSDRIECPVCAGRGTIRGRPWKPGTSKKYECGLCLGDGSVPRDAVTALLELRRQMQRVADAMQAGREDAAAAEARSAARLAFRLMA